MLDWLHTTGRLLGTSAMGRVMESHPEIDSTNARALSWASEGAVHGSMVVAEKQTAGRGRHGRSWDGGQGESLLFSLVVRPQMEKERFGLLPLAAGLAVRDAVEPLPGLPEPALKWPNDLLVGGRKCAGILVESVMPAGSAPWAVVGIGLNVNQDSFPESLKEIATSLRLASGKQVARPLLLAHLLEAFEERLGLAETRPSALVQDYLQVLHGVGRPVRFRHPDGRVTEGVLSGIDHSGALRVETGGQEEVYTAGEISLSAAG
ncbi:MAG: biotin--[acetyl-CoA-carboxylase] ligase [Rhodothermales bacterium]|nr:biotin--[acetyl-CoA-carboxylase] ligase [Rhodothermales bacterium]